MDDLQWYKNELEAIHSALSNVTGCCTNGRNWQNMIASMEFQNLELWKDRVELNKIRELLKPVTKFTITNDN